MDIVDDIAQWGFPLVLSSITVLGDDDVDVFPGTIVLGFAPSIVYVMQQLVKAPGNGIWMTIVASVSNRISILVLKNIFDSSKVSVKDRNLV
jgi:hypothetical protein